MTKEKTHKVKGVSEALCSYSEMSEFEWLKEYKSLYYKVVLYPSSSIKNRLSMKITMTYPNIGLLEREFYDFYSEILNKYIHTWDFENGILYISSLKKEDITNHD